MVPLWGLDEYFENDPSPFWTPSFLLFFPFFFLLPVNLIQKMKVDHLWKVDQRCPTPFGLSYRFLGQKFQEKKSKRGHRCWFALHLPSWRKRTVDKAFVVLPCSDPCNCLLKQLHHRIKYKYLKGYISIFPFWTPSLKVCRDSTLLFRWDGNGGGCLEWEYTT